MTFEPIELLLATIYNAFNDSIQEGMEDTVHLA